jgi:hypothetical protein
VLGTLVAIRVYDAPESAAHGAIDAAFAEIAATEQAMSFHRPDSDVSPAQPRRALLACAGRPAHASCAAAGAILRRSNRRRFRHHDRSAARRVGPVQPFLVSMRLDGNGTVIRRITADDGNVATNEYIELATMLVKFVAAKEQTTEAEVLGRLNYAVTELVSAD